MTDSILLTVKHMLGGAAETETVFDQDIIVHINSALFVLNQLGIGTRGFKVTDNSQTWSEFLQNDPTPARLEAIKTDVYLRVKNLFDPPANSFVVSEFNTKSAELEWRLNVEAEQNLEDASTSN